MRAVVVSENMGLPLDEGIRKFATMLVRGLAESCEAAGILTTARPVAPGLRYASGGKLFLGRDLWRALRAERPDLVIYVPSSSGTLFSFLRGKALKQAVPQARLAMVLTQRREHSLPARQALRWLAPDALWCQSQETIGYFADIGMEARFLPSGVDPERFRPSTADEKKELRAKYGLPRDEFLVLHAGHLKRERNIGLLGRLNGIGRGIVLASGSMGSEEPVRRQLAEAGVILIDRYVEAAQELYQAADCYLFPARRSDSAMEFPLSVLEAMACNLPVVSYPYGGLPLALEPRDGLVFAKSDDDLIAGVRFAAGTAANTRAQAESFSWKRIGQMVLETESVRDAGDIAAAV